MRRGCISLGEVKCDKCGRIIPYPDRYLAVEEKKGKESWQLSGKEVNIGPG